MEDSAYLMQLLAGAFYLAVSVPLFRLAARSGQRPERTLGWAFLLFGLSYVFYQTPFLPGLAHLLIPLSTLGRIATAAGIVTIALFTRIVFRSDAAWALWLVRGSASLFVAGLAISIANEDWEGFAPLSNPGFWLEWVGLTAPLIWVSLKGFLHYAGARKRVKFGLCDPFVSNRFFVWGLFGFAQFCTMAVMVPMCIGYERHGTISTWTDTAMGGFEMFTIAMVWLAFFPPAFYRSWLAESAVADAAGGAER